MPDTIFNDIPVTDELLANFARLVDGPDERLSRIASDILAAFPGRPRRSAGRLDPLTRLALRCPARGKPIEGCGCHRCAVGQGDGGRVDLIVCLLCQRARVRALPAPR